jgi:hypothetical protein
LLLFIVSLRWPNWIELFLGVAPDNGNGSVEWLIVALSALAATMAFAITAIEWRRTQADRMIGDAADD